MTRHPNGVGAIAAVVLLASLAGTPCGAAGDEVVQKLTAEPPVVLLNGGVGSVTLVCAVKAQRDGTRGEPPAITITDAVGPRDVIPASAFTFAWDSVDSRFPSILRGRLAVQRPVAVEPSVVYKGTLVLVGAQGASQSLEFTVVDKKAVSFEVETEKPDLAYAAAQAFTLALRVKNNGQVPIVSVEVSTLGLVDGPHRLVFSETLPLAIAPSKEAVTSMYLPVPNRAGTYAGNVRVTVNGGAEGRSVPLTVRARGPNTVLGLSSPYLPAGLFLLVVVAGFGISSLLDRWYGEGGGLARADATLVLLNAQRDLNAAGPEVARWTPLQNAAAWISARADEVDRAVPAATDTEITVLKEQAKRFQLAAEQAHALLWAVEFARARWGGQELDAVLAQLDRVPLAEPAPYRDALQRVLVAFGKERGLAVLPTPPESAAAKLLAKKGLMGFLYGVVGAAVIVLSAYLLFYFKNAAFGSFPDYAAVLLWTLGLTETGKKLVARAK